MGGTVGTYRLLGKLGEGGMGVVYVGEHTLLGRRAAIKVLLPELSARREIVHRFFNEARAVTQITDPGIVQVFDFGYAEDGSAYIVMELLEGEGMDKRLRRIGRFSPLDCVRMLRLICTSLAAAHGKGIVHRDLKPENIYLVGDPAVTGGERPKILDFGIAKLAHQEGGDIVRTHTSAVMGTPMYMSPEQCRGAGFMDHRSDIYSIGCVMMVMLTGEPPFSGNGSGDLIVAHMTARPPLAAERVPGMPPIIDEIMQRCLAKDANQRYQSMQELAQALAHAEQAITGAVMPRAMSAPQLHYAAASTPTTLSSAASQHGTGNVTAPPRGKTGLIAAAVGVVAVAGIAIAVIASGGDKKSAAPAAAPEPAPPVAAPAPAPVAAPTPAPTPTPTPPAPTPAAAVDAGVPEIAQTPPIDAGVAKAPEKPRTKPRGKPNARPTGTSTGTSVDRGD